MKLSSDFGAAQRAVAGFTAIDPRRTADHVTLKATNISSTIDGTAIANKLVSCLTELTTGVKRQAGNVTALATELEERDNLDAGMWGGTS
ncbi:hypothetical protein [uncultured Leifsonia sp.]|uniref:hypothetical protein n=1 Tax=uncultured Leifsonia sp. TaxID=340359 RepID=UPI0025FA938D|nr:hypothetical protein [uncultured Leifsonia sp.]